MLRTHIVSPTCCFVHETVIWRILKVHQVVLGGLPKVLVGHGKACAILVHGDLDGPVVLLAEVISSLSEVGHSQPTSPQCAGATDSMTFTLKLHESLHSLQGQ